MKVKSLLLLVLTLSLASCSSYGQRGIFGSGLQVVTGSGNIKTEVRNLSDFTGVETNGSISVTIKRSANFEVKVEADDNLLPYIVPEVSGNVLYIKMKSNMNIVSSKRMHVYVSMPQLTALGTRGSGSISCESKFEGNELVAKTQGSGSIQFSFDGKSAVVSTQGSGGIKFSGSIRKTEINTHGSGSIKAQLTAEATQLSTDGSGSINISGTTNNVIAQVQGSGSINGYDFQSVQATVSTHGFDVNIFKPSRFK